MKKAIAAAGIGVALAASAPAQAQAPTQEPIRVGILDVEANELTFRDRNTRITYREFTPEGRHSASWQTESGVDHGQVVASAFVRQVRRIDPDRPIEIFAANAMYENSMGTGQALYNRHNSSRTVSLNTQGAREAMRWFRENNVKVVITTMAGVNNEAMRGIMQEARQQGLVVFASAGNKPNAGRVYPGAYPDVISVAGDNQGLALRGNPDVASWVTFAMDGAVPRGPRDGSTMDTGSSFAVAKAAAFGSIAVADGHASDREGVVGYMRNFVVERSYQVANRNVTVSFIDEREAAAAAARGSAPERPAVERQAVADQGQQQGARTAAFTQAASQGM